MLVCIYVIFLFLFFFFFFFFGNVSKLGQSREKYIIIANHFASVFILIIKSNLDYYTTSYELF